jgi:hypothetical protein
MSDSRAAAALDRLPWLEDEPQRSPKVGLAGLVRWSVPALVALAGGSYWLGTRSAPHDEISAPQAEAPVVFTEALPEPQPAVTQAPAAEATLPAPAVRGGRTVTRRALPARADAKRAEPKPTAAAAKARYWPARHSASAAGRMVRIGTFESPQQAKKGWRGVVGIYPGMAQIPAVVVPSRSIRDGSTYSRLQMGTNSQAHSEVLCQRMRSIGQSCVVIGLPKAQS